MAAPPEQHQQAAPEAKALLAKKGEEKAMAKLMLERTRGQYRVNCEHTRPKNKMFKFNKSDPDSEAQAKKEAEDYLAELNTK